ncbi:MAG: hypothetical protein ABH863_00925 [Candidatus Micrarchaeota archaeon]
MQKIIALAIFVLLLGCTQPAVQENENSITPIPSVTTFATISTQPTGTQTPLYEPTMEEMIAECRQYALPPDCNDVPADDGGDICRKCKGLGIVASPLPTKKASAMPEITHEAPNQVFWEFIDEWKPSSIPPECPEKIIRTAPVDWSIATSILYPGQVRGGDYKAHGGIRFDNSGNGINIHAPLDGYLMRGSRYLQNGELQYLIEILNPCGIMYRFDHLSELSPKILEAASKFKPAEEGDSRTTAIAPIEILGGELIATKIGVNNNVFVDFGLYDLRNTNDASKNPDWLRQHSGQLAPYGICWLGQLPQTDAAIVKALPGGDSTSGKQSDYC